MRGQGVSAVAVGADDATKPVRALRSAPSRALPAQGQMLAAERKQGSAPCCWIRGGRDAPWGRLRLTATLN